jgi:hypothetical protein
VGAGKFDQKLEHFSNKAQSLFLESLGLWLRFIVPAVVLDDVVLLPTRVVVGTEGGVGDESSEEVVEVKRVPVLLASD